jgi:hypothetical protein
MTDLDDLLQASAPRVASSATLHDVTRRLTRRPRTGIVVAAVAALSLAGGTAAAAGTGALDDVIDYYLNGNANDHAWEMDITGVDGEFHCIGGIVVLPAPDKPDYRESDYLAIKKFVQDHDWTDLRPDPGLLHTGQTGTAEQLAITADRRMIEVAVDAGYTTDSISTLGTATCEPK